VEDEDLNDLASLAKIMGYRPLGKLIACYMALRQENKDLRRLLKMTALDEKVEL
jgi:hypothetical protein